MNNLMVESLWNPCLYVQLQNCIKQPVKALWDVAYGKITPFPPAARDNSCFLYLGQQLWAFKRVCVGQRLLNYIREICASAELTLSQWGYFTIWLSSQCLVLFTLNLYQLIVSSVQCILILMLHMFFFQN